jgi:hypothetical protein
MSGLILVKARLREVCNELSLPVTIVSIRENSTASLEGFIPAEGGLKSAAYPLYVPAVITYLSGWPLWSRPSSCRRAHPHMGLEGVFVRDAGRTAWGQITRTHPLLSMWPCSTIATSAIVCDAEDQIATRKQDSKRQPTWMQPCSPLAAT